MGAGSFSVLEPKRYGVLAQGQALEQGAFQGHHGALGYRVVAAADFFAVYQNGGEILVIAVGSEGQVLAAVFIPGGAAALGDLVGNRLSLVWLGFLRLGFLRLGLLGLGLLRLGLLASSRLTRAVSLECSTKW